MTVITLTTVGFGETYPLGTRGRMFTIFLIITGVITIGYVVNQLTEALLERKFLEARKRKQLSRMLDSLSHHYIICGYGRIGKQICEEFAKEGTEFIIVDSTIEQVNNAKMSNYLAIKADATLDESLLRVRVDRAQCLVAALPSDAENLYIILSAKTLNPKIRAIARASSEEAVQKLQRAGADVVISPYITGAKRMAAAAIRPGVLDFVDGIMSTGGNSFYMEEFLIDENTCPMASLSLKDAQLRMKSGALVLAIRRDNQELIVGPTGDTIIMGKDMLICMGTADQLRALNRILAPMG